MPVAEQPLTEDVTATPWAAARERLENPEQGRTNWLATVRPDGRPHVMPLLRLSLDGAFYFISGESTRKGKNLAGDSHRGQGGEGCQHPGPEDDAGCGYRQLEALKQPERQQRLDHEAAAMCGMMPRVQPIAATMLARIPRERPAASV